MTTLRWYLLLARAHWHARRGCPVAQLIVDRRWSDLDRLCDTLGTPNASQATTARSGGVVGGGA